MPRKPVKKVTDETSDTQVEVQTETPAEKRRGRKPAASTASSSSTATATTATSESTQKRRGRKPAASTASSSAAATSSVTVPSSSESSETKKRTVPTRESVETEFASLSSLIEAEIENLKNTKSSGVKFLRTVNKRLKILRAHTARISKKRKPANRTNTGNSGFLKPVDISDQLSEFTGWSKEEPRSRVEVTKYICNYIKEKDLQNPNDKREILVDKDNKLKKLLGYPRKGETKPLTYYTLQTYLKNHFPAKTA